MIFLFGKLKSSKYFSKKTKATFSAGLFLFLFFIINASQAQAATIYSNSSTGNDSTGDGSSGNPYKTFHKAYTESDGGDTLDLTGTFSWTNADETGDATSSGYTIDKNITIQGQGADETIIQAESSYNTANRRIFALSSSQITIQNLSVRYGKSTSSGGGIYVDTDSNLTLTNVEVYSCVTTGSGGGGIFNAGDLTITNSAIYSNLDDWSGGGIAMNATDATMAITNSTIYNNTNSGGWNLGGGIWIGDGEATVTNCTITGNSAGSGDGVAVYRYSGTANMIIKNTIAVDNNGDRSLYASSGGTITNNGYNIVDKYYGFTPTNGDWTDTDDNGTYQLYSIGTTGELYLDSGASINDNPNKTRTYAITSSSSVAINNADNNANNGVDIPATDQRTATRVSLADIGAFEYNGGLSVSEPSTQSSDLTFSLVEYNQMTVSWTVGDGSRRVVFAKEGDSGSASPVDGAEYTASAVFGSGDQISTTGWYAIYDGTGDSVDVTGLSSSTDYRFHVIEYNGIDDNEADYNSGTANDNPSTQATYSPTTIYCNSDAGDDSLGDGSENSPYKTFHKCYTEANGGDTIDLTGTFTWSDADETGDASSVGYGLLKDLTIIGQGVDATYIQADSTATTADRRVFYINGATVNISNLTIRYGNTNSSGGCISSGGSSSNLILDKVEVNNCRSMDGNGGGIYTSNSMTLTNSAIYSNYATGSLSGGGLELYGSDDSVEFIITNTTIYDNEITTGTWNAGGGVHLYRGIAYMTNCTVTNNVSPGSGSGIYVYTSTSSHNPTLYLKNTITAENVGDYSRDLYHQGSYGSIVNSGNNVIGKYYDNGSDNLDSNNWIDSNADGTYIWDDDSGTTGTLELDSAPAINSSLYGTRTYAITSSDSVAVNNGDDADNVSVAVPTVDQRGLSRVGATDIGAYEYGGVNNTAPTFTSVSISPDKTSGVQEITLTPSGQADDDSDNLYFYCNESGSPTSADTLCDEADTSYSSGDYSSMSCSYSVTTGNESRTVYCRAYDGTGYSTEKTTTYIADATSPSVDAGADQTKKAQFTQDATTSDGGTGITSYTWSKQSGTGTITFGSATSEDTTVLASEDGTYVIRLTVTDNVGNLAYDEFTLVWNADAPTISNVEAEANDDSATITWTTDEQSDSQLEYGLTSSFGSTESSSTLGTTHSLTASSLKSCSTYYYRVTSEDNNSNSANSETKTFHTSGCEVSSITGGASGSVDSSLGGSVSINTTNGNARLSAPSGYHSQNLTIQINKLNTQSAPSAPTGVNLTSDNFFELLAIDDSGNVIATFDKPLTFTVFYGSDIEARYNEGSLDVYKYINGEWVARNCILDTEANTLTCELSSFSTYGVLGQEIEEEDEEEEVQKADIKSWKAEQYTTDSSCPNRLKLTIKGKHFAEDLEVRIGGTEARSVNRIDSHNLTAKFCLDELWDVKTKLNRRIHVINSDAEDEKSDKRIHLEDFPINTNELVSNQSLVSTSLQIYSGDAQPKVCSYVVKDGDSLWTIAKEVYNDSNAYPKIIESNKEKYPDIESRINIGDELNFDCSGSLDRDNDNNDNNETEVKGVSVENQTPDQVDDNSQEEKDSNWWNPFSWF